MKQVSFTTLDGTYILKKKRVYAEWLISSAGAEGFVINKLSVNFCTDNYLLEFNKEYLNHKTLTDIITFPYNEDRDGLEGELFLSIERIRENAQKFNSPFEHEFARVMIHGLLHLMGYKDKSREEKSAMRLKEEGYLNQLFNL